MKALRRFTRIAAGHAAAGDDKQGIFVPEGDRGQEGRPETILKALDDAELCVYERLNAEHEEDSARAFMPSFHGVVEDVDEQGNHRRFLRMSNLLQPFDTPCVMDVKLGIRTFLEAEMDNKQPRPDLYERMCKSYPSQPTPEERAAGSVTKYRWMSVRDAGTTTSVWCFRIDGQWRPDSLGRRPDALSPEATHLAFRRFAEAAAGEAGPAPSAAAAAAARGLLADLRCLRSAMEASAFLKQHECIGTSVLLVADAQGRTGAFWIDFGKTRLAPPGLQLTHRGRWLPGNHEDGLLLGMDNLVEAWAKVLAELEAREEEPPCKKAKALEAHQPDARANGCGSDDGPASPSAPPPPAPTG